MQRSTACVFLFLCAAAPRTEAAHRLAEAERQRAEQTRTEAIAQRDLLAAQAQSTRLGEALASQASALRGVEAAVTAASARLAAAVARQDAAERGLARARAAFTGLLPVMLRLSQAPAGSMLAAPVPPADAVRGLVVVCGLAVTLERQAVALRAEAAEAAAAREATRQQAAALALARAQQAARAAALDRSMAQAHDQVSQAEAEGRAAAEQVARAGAQARTLREAIAAMDAAQARAMAQAAREARQAGRRHQDSAAEAARAREAALARPQGDALAGSGQLTVPVAGTMLRAFGAAAEDGPATGITFGVAPGAVVSSPCAGRVAFAAPFRSYGQLVIVDCGGGTDIVLAGLGSIGASPGHPVRPGEPVGRAQARLYMELRARGRPIDPAPFLTGGA